MRSLPGLDAPVNNGDEAEEEEEEEEEEDSPGTTRFSNISASDLVHTRSRDEHTPCVCTGR